MSDAEATDLWKNSLGRTLVDGDAESARIRFVASLRTMRERASLLASEISRDLPEFTVHDDSHSDALWGLADRVGGSSLILNPAEGFVFGAALLIHDLGMASAAYVDGDVELESEPRWTDTVAAVLQGTLGSVPSAEQLAEPDAQCLAEAKTRILRDLHAEHAERLATLTWEDAAGKRYSLLEDADLRDSLGQVIGKVAHSHWWSVRQVGEEFRGDLGAPPGVPPDWTVRPLVLACLLRLADICHLDGSRAPRFLRLLRNPGPESKQHWDFQARLSQPLLREDRIVFTGSPFPAEEADAWWLCADILAAVDREFGAVDSLLADRQQQRFAVHGVAGAGDYNAMAELIPTDGWTPIDARVRVSNVVRLVNRLGGRELYGSRPDIPLREMIQNASDAVRARRIVDLLDESDGSIEVSISEPEAEGGRWLEVRDSGIGMSRDVLADHLLDFGTSFWNSEQVIGEFPGLLSGRFKPTGQFGIGFFSIFMWGGDVDVTSRRYDASRAETHVLEFRGGVSKRPIIRVAERGEQMREPGTSTRVLLDAETIWRLGFDDDGEATAVESLRRLCAWLAPAVEVDTDARVGSKKLRAVSARDWIDMPMGDLSKRILDSPIRSGEFQVSEIEEEDDPAEEDREFTRYREDLEAEREKLFALVDATARLVTNSEGQTLGRLSALPLGGVTVVGGLRATEVFSMTGILIGEPTTASRNAAVAVIPPDRLAAWASEQAELLSDFDGSQAVDVAGIVWACGGDLGKMPIAETSNGRITIDEFRDWLRGREEILVVHDAAVFNAKHDGGEFDLGPDVVAVKATSPSMSISAPADPIGSDAMGQTWDVFAGALVGALAQVVGEEWDISREQLKNSYYREFSQVVGYRGGAEVKMTAASWAKPDS